MTAACLSVLSSTSELYATKRIRQDRKTGRIIKTDYGRETWFRVRQIALDGFPALCRCLDALTARPFAFVIRGEPLPDADLNRTRRLAAPDPKSGDKAAFVEAGRHWFAVDIDKVRRPVAIDPIVEPHDAIEYLIGLLPPDLHDASCWWQFTCSQSLPGNEDTLSARLWFWCRGALDDAALKRWATSANKAAGFKLVDTSLYTPVQPHYVADPVFEDGMRDPLPRRHGVRVGLEQDVQLVIPDPIPDDHTGDAGSYVGRGVEHYLAAIGDDDGFRTPMVAAIASYFAIYGATADPGPIKAKVREAIQNANPGERRAADISRYCSDRHLDEIVAWVRAHERTKSVSARISPRELCDAVPIGDERALAMRKVLQHLLRQRYLDPHLAVTLAECFNQARCSPPLPSEHVRAIANTLADRLLAANGLPGHGR
jgi:hypothetical protein